NPQTRTPRSFPTRRSSDLYKRDAIDAELLARMRLAGCIPAVYVTSAAQQEWAILIRHRTALVRHRTMVVNRLHAQLHTRGLHLRSEEHTSELQSLRHLVCR